MCFCGIENVSLSLKAEAHVSQNDRMTVYCTRSRVSVLGRLIINRTKSQPPVLSKVMLNYVVLQVQVRQRLYR